MRLVMLMYSPVIGLALIGLSLPSALREQSWKRFFISLSLSYFGVYLPICMYCVSDLLGEPWNYGQEWNDNFQIAKLAISPLLLWATCSLYVVDIYRTPNRTRLWIVLGMLNGAILGMVSLGIGIYLYREFFVLVSFYFPLAILYLPVWYLVRARQLLREAKPVPPERRGA